MMMAITFLALVLFADQSTENGVGLAAAIVTILGGVWVIVHGMCRAIRWLVNFKCDQFVRVVVDSQNTVDVTICDANTGSQSTLTPAQRYNDLSQLFATKTKTFMTPKGLTLPREFVDEANFRKTMSRNPFFHKWIIWLKFSQSYEFKQWRTRVQMDIPNPNVGIVTRKDKIQDRYYEKTSGELLCRVGNRMKEWIQGQNNAALQRTRGVTILVIGMNEKRLVREILSFVGKTTGRDLFVTFDDFRNSKKESEIEQFFGGDDKKKDHDHVYVQSGCSAGMTYDIILHMHWFQHQYPGTFDKVFVDRHLRAGGLLVWLSAVSRSNNVEEYVGECWIPKSVGAICSGNVNDLVDAVRFVDLRNPSCESYIKYGGYVAPYQNNQFCALGLGHGRSVPRFPMTFIVKEFKDDAFLVRAKECLHRFWGGGYTVELKKRVDIAANAETNSYSQCYVIKIIDHVNKKENYFIVTKGIESYAFARDKNCYITFYPASMVSGGAGQNDQNYENGIDVILAVNGLDAQRYRNEGYVKCCSCANGDAKVWNVFTPLRDVDLQDFLICAVNKDAANTSYYYTILPKKQYFTKTEFENKLAEMDSFESDTERFGKGFPRPYMLWSLTHLETYGNLKQKLDGFDIEIDDKNVWFHKCFGVLNDLDWKKREIDGWNDQKKDEFKGHNSVLFDGNVKEEEGEVYYDASVEKDKAFNLLPLETRLELLGQIAAHDVLFFGIKRGKDR